MTSTPVSRADFDRYMMPNYAPGPIIPVRGQGSRVWDQEDREYVDFAGGIAVSALGHAHPALVAALTEQAGKLWHLSNLLASEPAIALARRLTELTFADRVFFANSGGEANEAALKLARRYAWDHDGESRHKIVSTHAAFHGRTLFTVTTGGQPKYTEGFGPLPGGITHVPYDDLDAMREVVGRDTCAVIVEPIQGESGVRTPAAGYLRGLREICDDAGALLIFDEIQTGAGRTGKLYAYMHEGVAPDILTTAKGIGGGFPIAATLATEKVAASLVPGTHGSTFGGNPMGCAVALAVLDELTRPGVLEAVEAKSRALKAGLARIGEAHDLFAEIRGHGLLIGCQLSDRYAGKARDLMLAALDAGLLALIAGPNVLRLAPSLIIPEADIEAGLERLDAAVSSFVAQADAA